MRIPGIPGFRPPTVELQAFKAALYAAARADRSEVGDLCEPGVTPSFYSARLRSARRELYVLCDPLTGLIAFASPPLEMPLRFVHGGPTAEALQALGWTCATPELLARRLTEEEIAGLSDDERRALAYWRPDSVGAVLFNWFD